MRKTILLLTVMLTANFLLAQQSIDSIAFFADEKPVELTITTDIKALQNQRKPEKIFQDGSVTLKLDDNTTYTENIKISTRGKTRKEMCRIPPLMINFRTSPQSLLKGLGKLKLVIACGTSQGEEELLFKEFMCYKIYNILENKSFRVRLAKTTYVDSKNKAKTVTQYAFFIEDDADMAKRNGCKKKDKYSPFNSEGTNRDVMTMVALYEYFIGNTDWSVPNGHNTKLIFDKNPEIAIPYVVPYDFDYSGLVNAEYAVPAEIMGTEKVTERVYRGFARTMEELQLKLTIFENKKADIYAKINGFTFLAEKTKKGMISYLEEFYAIAKDNKLVKRIFIDEARKN